MTVAQISLQAIVTKAFISQDDNNRTNQPIPIDLVVDKKVQQLLKVTNAFFNAKSATELLEETSSTDDSGDRLFVLRKWLTEHPFEEDAIEVVEAAINDAIRASDFSPNATFYREITTALPFCTDAARRKKVKAVIEGQNPIIIAKGPTIDYIRLQLQLAHCNVVDNEFERASARLEELYFEHVDKLKELEIRITCLAWFVAELKHFNPEEKIQEFVPIRELVDYDLESAFSDIINNGADHFSVLSRALAALAVYVPETAIILSKKLNTIKRRQRGLCHIAISMCRAATVIPDSTICLKILGEIESGPALDSLFLEISQRFVDDFRQSKRYLHDLKQLEANIQLCSSAAMRAECLAWLAGAIAGLEDAVEYSEILQDRLLSEFNMIGTANEKYRIACKLIYQLRSKCPKIAQSLFQYIADPDRGH